MKRIIINRSNEYNEYIFKISGYIPKELEEDLQEMLEWFVEVKNPSIEEIKEEIEEFTKYHKNRNGIVIKSTINVENNENEGKTGNVIEINWHLRRKLNRYFEESFLR